MFVQAVAFSACSLSVFIWGQRAFGEEVGQTKPLAIMGAILLAVFSTLMMLNEARMAGVVRFRPRVFYAGAAIALAVVVLSLLSGTEGRPRFERMWLPGAVAQVEGSR